MKALIIGVAGFVGRHLAIELINAGWDVSGTRLPSEVTSLGFPVHELNILNATAIGDLLARTNPDCIFHLAAQSSVSVSWKKPALTVDVNIKGVVNLLESVRELENPPRVLLIGSGEEYGYILPDELPINEDTALRPGNIYAGTKIAQGLLGQIYARAYGLEIIIIRAFNHIGPGQTDTFVVPSFCRQVAEIEAEGSAGIIKVGNLEAKRDFTDVRDIVKAYRLLAERGESGVIYNVGSGRSISIRDILDMIIEQSGAIKIENDQARMRPSDTPVIEADISRLAECTGWRPEIAIETTLKDVLNEWRKRSCTLSFGTGGVRGIMGPGINHINRHTIQRVTHGFAKTILSSNAPKSVGVAYDTRHNSAEYAQIVCKTFVAFGITVYTFDKPMPTPTLSYAIQHLNLGWGVVITASHNPQEYNGYKVYDCHGVQVTDKIVKEITESIDSIGFFEPIPERQNAPITVIDDEVEEAYIDRIVSYVTTLEQKQCIESAAPYNLVYSALHGAGANAVPAVLIKLGFSPILIQQNPEGAFGGLKTPNPEEPAAYAEALAEAEKADAKLLLATDPDCDRVGVMVKTGHGFEPLSGNQIGALLIDYLAQTRGVSKGDTVISTIVSGSLGEQISRDYGLEFVRLLTGFKYIGEHIVNIPEDKHFFFGYEESYGFLAGDGARDKDAAIASALIVKMAAFYDSKDMTLLDRWVELSEKHGYCLESLSSAVASQNKQREIMTKLRNGIILEGLVRIEDYLPGIHDLTPSDVLKLYFNDGSWAALRPSGTEPKIKLYTGVRAKTHDEAKEALESLTKNLFTILERV